MRGEPGKNVSGQLIPTSVKLLYLHSETKVLLNHAFERSGRTLLPPKMPRHANQCFIGYRRPIAHFGCAKASYRSKGMAKQIRISRVLSARSFIINRQLIFMPSLIKHRNISMIKDIEEIFQCAAFVFCFLVDKLRQEIRHHALASDQPAKTNFHTPLIITSTVSLGTFIEPCRNFEYIGADK